MSWLFAIKGNFNEQDLRKFESLHSKELFKVSIPGLYIVAGGNPKTCFFKSENNEKSGFVVCGSGIKKENSSFVFMNINDWQESIKNENFTIENIDGHFTGIRWDENSLIAFNDILCGRDMYLSSTTKEYKIISTKLDFIASLNKNVKLKFEELSSIFLIGNQLTTRSILSDTIRLGQKGRAVIKNNNIEVNDNPWLPDFSNKKSEFSNNLLNELTLFPAKLGYDLTLCLSGGVDSRSLLNQLITSKGVKWNACTFGDPNHPDSIISRKMSNDLNFNFNEYYREIPDSEQSLKYITDFTKDVLLTTPASEFLNKRYFPDITSENNVITDGGFGEIARSGFFYNIYKLFFLGKISNIKTNFKKINSVLNYNRITFLSDEVLEIIKSGIIRQFEEIAETMPEPSKIGIVNWLDLLAVRYRYPNFYACEQARCDEIFLGNYPFCTNNFLKFIFSVPSKKRLYGTYHKSLIEKNTKVLKNYPFVKNCSNIPYFLAPIPAKIYGKVRNKFGLTYKDNTLHNFLYSMKNIILDFINSTTSKNCSYYNWNELNIIAEKYYKGEESHANKLDLWLVIEIFRREFGL